jgi:hypothetical protein
MREMQLWEKRRKPVDAAASPVAKPAAKSASKPAAKPAG